MNLYTHDHSYLGTEYARQKMTESYQIEQKEREKKLKAKEVENENKDGVTGYQVAVEDVSPDVSLKQVTS